MSSIYVDLALVGATSFMRPGASYNWLQKDSTF